MNAPWSAAQRPWYTLALPLAAPLYGTAMQIRSFAYDVGLKRTHRVPVPVICVGNITVGGTGKTPAVISICRKLLEWGERPAVLSRGYGGEKNKDEILRVSANETDWRAVGDEPLLIARCLPDVPVFVGADRVAAAQHAIEAVNPSVLVLDDGFQHRRLGRDLDIVLLDGMEPFGNGRLLPAGPLREPLRALHRAGLVVLTKSNLAHEAGVWTQRLSNRLNAPVIQSIHRPMRIQDLGADAPHSIEELRGKRVLAVSGLAKNETFVGLLRSLGAVIEGTLSFGDHQHYGADEWATIRRVFRESGADVLITTSKDAVKWSAAEIENLPVWVLEIAFEPTLGAERFWRVIRQTLQNFTSETQRPQSE